MECLSLKLFLFLFVCMVSMLHVYGYPWGPEEGVICEPTNVGAGNGSLVL